MGFSPQRQQTVISKSSSFGTFTHPLNQGMVRSSSLSPDYSHNRVNLITVELWEHITGERTTSTYLCDLQESLHTSGDRNASSADQTNEKTRKFLNMARDKTECRTLQQQLESDDKNFLNTVFNALMPYFYDLVFDQSANYVYQKFCEVATPQHNEILLKYFQTDINRIIDSPYGCRVLQKFIEYTDQKTVDQLFLDLRGNLIFLCNSLNGNHIVRRFIEALPDRVPEIIQIVQPEVLKLVVDNCGCRVIQKLFEHYSKKPLEPLEPLIYPILENAAILAGNQYGNYVIQIILTSEVQSHINTLVSKFSGHFYEFSIHKFASNVIEKCIRFVSDNKRQTIFDEIIGTEGNLQEDRIIRMVTDQFGNYVIQRIIEFGTQDQRDGIADAVEYNIDMVERSQFSRHVINCLTNLGYRF